MSMHSCSCTSISDLLEMAKAQKHRNAADEYPFTDGVLLQQPNKQQKRTPPLQSDWLVMKVLSSSTVITWERVDVVL